MDETLTHLRPGRVILLKSFKETFDTEEQQSALELSFSAGRGKRFVVLLLGAQPWDKPIDAKKALEALGWQLQPDVTQAIEIASPTLSLVALEGDALLSSSFTPEERAEFNRIYAWLQKAATLGTKVRLAATPVEE